METLEFIRACVRGGHIMNAYEWKNYTSEGGLALSSKVNWWPVNMSGANLLGLSVLFQMKTYKENWKNATFFLPVEQDGEKCIELLLMIAMSLKMPQQ